MKKIITITLTLLLFLFVFTNVSKVYATPGACCTNSGDCDQGETCTGIWSITCNSRTCENSTTPSDSIFGKVNAPPGVVKFVGGDIEGLTVFINNIIKFVIVAAGLYALINIVLSGFAFMSAGDDPKKVAGAWSKIWQSLLGLTVAAGAFVLAGIFGQLIFGDYNALLQIRIFGP